jgi:hypothetical protein
MLNDAKAMFQLKNKHAQPTGVIAEIFFLQDEE